MTDTQVTQEDRDNAAASFLGDYFDGPASWDDTVYGLASDWRILTDDEADEACIEDIRESLWAFNPSFLQAYLPAGVDADEVIAPMQEKLCESANPAVLALVGDRFDNLAQDAMGADGRGHFLASWDGAEIEFEHEGRTWYAYRS